MTPDYAIKKILELPRAIKRLVVIINDMCLCVLSVWLSFYLRLGEFISISLEKKDGYNTIFPVIISIIVALPIFMTSGFYRSIFRYSGWSALMTVLKASIIYFFIYSTIITAIGFEGVPRTIGIIQPILLLLSVGASRAFARFLLGGRYIEILGDSALPRILVYGAGAAGRQLVAALNNSRDCRVVGFLDDNTKLQNSTINGIHVYSPEKFLEIVSSLGINEIILAIPSVSRKRRNEILEKMRRAHILVHTLPSITELIQGGVTVSDIRDLEIDDLLGREQVVPDKNLLKKNITNKIVMVTGAGGSIGSELCRQIMKSYPKKLLLLEQSEHALYLINQELTEANLDSNTIILPLLGSVCDERRVDNIISHWRPDIIYHAAAYKHVPLVEHNPIVAINNNVNGTLILAKSAAKNEIENFVLISTDKAVRPTNIMGATKRLSEMILQALASCQNTTRFSMVRFGNVLDSSGSVVPRFRQQIRSGGPVTLTHPEITRYFMMIPEAAQLVLQAGAMAKGGEVFLLDMGQPIKIIELAHRMIELSGLVVRNNENPDGDIEIEIIGLRPGEKLYEELLIGENSDETDHPRIMKSKETYLAWKNLEEKLDNINTAMRANDMKTIHSIFCELIDGYNPNDGIVDWFHMDKINISNDNNGTSARS